MRANTQEQMSDDDYMVGSHHGCIWAILRCTGRLLKASRLSQSRARGEGHVAAEPEGRATSQQGRATWQQSPRRGPRGTHRLLVVAEVVTWMVDHQREARLLTRGAAATRRARSCAAWAAWRGVRSPCALLAVVRARCQPLDRASHLVRVLR